MYADLFECREIAVRNEALVHPLIANILSNELFAPRELRNPFNMQNLTALFQSASPLGTAVSSREEHSARVSATLALVFADFLLEGAASSAIAITTSNSGAVSPASSAADPAAATSGDGIGDGEFAQQQQLQQQMSENHGPALRERLRELHRLLRGEQHSSGGQRGAGGASSGSGTGPGSGPVPVPALDLVSFALALMHPRLEERDSFARSCRPLYARLNSLDELLDPNLSASLEHKFVNASAAYKKRFVEAVVELVTLSQLYSATPQVSEIMFPNGEYNRTNGDFDYSFIYTVLQKF